MITIVKKQQDIIAVLIAKPDLSSSAIHAALTDRGMKISLVTVKRTLSEMVDLKWIEISGAGPATTYRLTVTGRIHADVDAAAYCAVEPDRRLGLNRFNFDLLPSWPTDVFVDQELRMLELATREYHRRTTDLPPAIQSKELERLVIELSWKSSKIEGNTYTLLDTEKLILKHQRAPGHSASEARMILNHKDAFTYVHQHADMFTNLTRANVEELHAILVKGLSVGLGLRKKPVGVLGSTYRPLDNIHQISEAVEALSRVVAGMTTPYAKALVALVGISYIQPFEDGNKRTSRLMANALLMAHGCSPLSYRSVDEQEYRQAMLVFYELNSLVPIRKIFVEQYEFAATNYSVGNKPRG